MIKRHRTIYGYFGSYTVHVATVAAVMAASIHPALAVSSVDPEQGLRSLGAWLFLLAAGVIPLIFLVKGLQAMAQGEHYGKHIAGLLIGLAIAFGGFTIMSRWGGGGFAI